MEINALGSTWREMKILIFYSLFKTNRNIKILALFLKFSYQMESFKLKFMEMTRLETLTRDCVLLILLVYYFIFENFVVEYLYIYDTFTKYAHCRC